MENSNTELQVVNMQEVIPAAEAVALYKSASTLQLQPEENKALLQLFTDDQFEIRPDGHIYLPQAIYRDRLNQSLGIGQWSLIVKATTQQEKTNDFQKKTIKMLLNGVLVIRGCFVAEAVGEAELHETNDQQSLATVWESAKSDCITRCCKDLSIGQQSSLPAYQQEWKNKYAVKVWIKDKKTPMWRKASAGPLPGETGLVDPAKPFPFQHPQNERPWLNKAYKNGGAITAEWKAATAGLADGSLTIAILKDQYKINADTLHELQQLAAAGAGKGEVQNKEAEIPGAVYAKMEKCKTKQDVDQLAIEYRAEIEKHGNWRLFFGKEKAQRPPAPPPSKRS